MSETQPATGKRFGRALARDLRFKSLEGKWITQPQIVA